METESNLLDWQVKGKTGTVLGSWIRHLGECWCHLVKQSWEDQGWVFISGEGYSLLFGHLQFGMIWGIRVEMFLPEAFGLDKSECVVEWTIIGRPGWGVALSAHREHLALSDGKEDLAEYNAEVEGTSLGLPCGAGEAGYTGASFSTSELQFSLCVGIDA